MSAEARAVTALLTPFFVAGASLRWSAFAMTLRSPERRGADFVFQYAGIFSRFNSTAFSLNHLNGETAEILVTHTLLRWSA